MPHPADVTLALLAGGRGTRMGGPKSALTLRGQPILQFLHAQLAWAGPTLLITSPGNERPPGAHLFTAEAVDTVAGEGPLRGILTALRAATTDVVAIATVDMPSVTAAQLHWLIARLGDDARAVMCSRPAKGADRIESFPCVVRRSMVDAIARRLAAGHRSVHGLAEEEPDVRLRPAPPEWPDSVWTNLNHPEDLAAFERGEAADHS